MTPAEQNYLKTIFHLSGLDRTEVSTNAIAHKMDTKAASVTDMLKKLADKGWVDYQKYQGVTLTAEGHQAATQIIRKHRLWEYFLVHTLHFGWDQVHEVAEQLEHIESEVLIDRLDTFLQYPTHDPHGDPIPDRHGQMPAQVQLTLSELKPGERATLVGVLDSSAAFLQYLTQWQLGLGSALHVQSVMAFDGSVQVEVHGSQLSLSQKAAALLLVRKG